MYHALQLDVTSETGTTVVRFTIAGESSILGAQDIEAMIEQLANIRAAMQPARPLSPPSGTYPMELDPCWRVDRLRDFDGAVLSLRHVGKGWTAFALPASSLASLFEALSSLPHTTPRGERTMLN
ncbi:hypothetical protein [Paraburkholderia oxyphila]|uniref:hypothetical protein n=1 Tax=Paraburkholderia oxyphila TaxID=614212 RepID=UPI0005BD45FA|nr:hypothetical protein [Paraburkholderia oxyphila]